MRQSCTRVLAAVAVAALLSPAAGTPLLAAAHQAGGERRGPGRPSDPKRPITVDEHNGLNPGQWLAVWWQAFFANASEELLTSGGIVGGNDRVVILGALVQEMGTPPVKTRVTIPAGAHVVVPIITVECSPIEPDFFGADEAEMRACANSLLDVVVRPSASVDGRAIENMQAHRVETPLFRFGPLPADNVLMVEAGTQADAVGAGYVLVLPPFSPGVHRLALSAEVPLANYIVDTEFMLNVVPQKK